MIAEALRLEAHRGANRLDRGRMQMARVWRARATLGAGRPDDAARILAGMDLTDESIPTWGHAWIDLVRGKLARANGNYAAALELFESAVEQRDRSPVAAKLAREELLKF